MRQRPLLLRSILALVVLLALDGWRGTAEPSNEEILRRAFPAQAALVLERGGPLVEVAEGFRAEVAPSGLSASFPRSGDGVLGFGLGGGFEVRVRELGARGE